MLKIEKRWTEKGMAGPSAIKADTDMTDMLSKSNRGNDGQKREKL